MENEKHTEGHEIWQETLENVKKNTHWWTLIIARKLKNMENDTQALYNLKYGKKH
jgi:hypothetical protein